MGMTHQEAIETIKAHYPDERYDVESLIKDQPTIDAVPLDKLCEWLAEKAVFFANDNDSDPEEWKETIKECVMEGERETD